MEIQQDDVEMKDNVDDIKVVIKKSITHEEYVIKTLKDELVFDFIKKAAQANGIKELENFKVFVGSQNINQKKYLSKRMSFFLVEKKPFYSSLVFQIEITESTKKYSVPYISGSPQKYCKFWDGKEFDYKRKDHQLKLLKEKKLIKKKPRVDAPLEFFSGGLIQKGSQNKSVPLSINDIQSFQPFSPPPTMNNFSNNQSNYLQSSSSNDYFNSSSDGNEFFEPYAPPPTSTNQNNNISFFGMGPQRTKEKVERKQEASFINLDKSKVVNHKFANNPSVPTYRSCRRGANFFSNCKNNLCKAFGKMIVVPMGYGDFDILLKGEFKCPCCSSDVDPLNCGFTDCWWKFCGEKMDGTLVSKEWNLSEGVNSYSTFIHDEMKTKDDKSFDNLKNFCVQWKILKFMVRNPKDSLKELDPDNSFCSICIENVMSFLDLEMTKCNHPFHKECLHQWVEQAPTPTCPMCRRVIKGMEGKKKQLNLTSFDELSFF